MKTVTLHSVAYYLVHEIEVPDGNGKTRLTLVPVHGTGVYIAYRKPDGSYSKPLPYEEEKCKTK